jgi:hypothetical protein
MTTEHEYWDICIPLLVSSDEHDLIDSIKFHWENIAVFAADDDLYDMYEGAIESGPRLRPDEYNEMLTREGSSGLTSYSEITDAFTDIDESGEGVTPFRIRTESPGSPSSTTATAGFSVAYEIGSVPRAWFGQMVIINDNKRDYKVGSGALQDSDSEKLLIKMFDRSSSSGTSFKAGYLNLIDAHVAEITKVTGDLRETSATYKQSSKRTPSLKETSTFELDKFEQTGATVATSAITTTLTTGEY